MPPARSSSPHIAPAKPYITPATGGIKPNQVIVISDDEDAASVPPVSRRLFNKGKGRSRAVLEAIDMEREVERLREELNKKQIEALEWKAECIQSAIDAERLREKMNSMPRSIPVSALEDIICCTICCLPMWSPYLLRNCGHTFCQSCLVGWFRTIHQKHLDTTPAYHVELREQLPVVPLPVFTCPLCREPARVRPVRSFLVASAVEVVGQHKGEAAPHEDVVGVEAVREAFYAIKRNIYAEIIIMKSAIVWVRSANSKRDTPGCPFADVPDPTQNRQFDVKRFEIQSGCLESLVNECESLDSGLSKIEEFAQALKFDEEFLRLEAFQDFLSRVLNEAGGLVGRLKKLSSLFMYHFLIIDT
ncbi:hypothetical protein BV25DRAFT_1922182 [Artomyces pyxidatus]|uniref:Uncharacterized protein n=1 Tax=Artomyces pyxidatus TaxID=48021 RepID=A0ACB8SG50_9AGAM|nr:hypothetical protein BV25DRAFT_1922182 [Artomyces pyxidatus]